MQRFLLVFGAFFAIALGAASGARAAEMVNVEYIHMAVKQKWGIDVPYNANLEDPKVAANMKYLLAVVDKANEMINGAPITDYSHGEFATEFAADTVATNDVVARLIKETPKFTVTTTSDAVDFAFVLSVVGQFTVDWGDGETQVINQTNTTSVLYYHEFSWPGSYTVTISGRATEYSTKNTEPAIAFAYDPNAQTKCPNDANCQCTNVAEISGGLGKMFPNLATGAPKFLRTFYQCTNLTEIPADLFDGLTAPGYAMFPVTFADCTGLTSIPENLFAGISGAPAERMFYETFRGCSALTSIPENLFAGISVSDTAQKSMFEGTFRNCRNLTGPSALIDGKYLYEIWPDSGSTSYGKGCYGSSTGLDDYATMPASWK